MAVPNIYKGAGFDFSNHNRYVAGTAFLPKFRNRRKSRNEFLAGKGIPVPKATSTGTTIVGCLYEGGVVLGADTRATAGPIVADKNCEKVRHLQVEREMHSF